MKNILCMFFSRLPNLDGSAYACTFLPRTLVDGPNRSATVHGKHACLC